MFIFAFWKFKTILQRKKEREREKERKKEREGERRKEKEREGEKERDMSHILFTELL